MKSKNKGITLVALILTIVILLILAVVTIRSIQGEGIIAKAMQAREKYEGAADEEQGMLDKYLQDMQGISSGSSSSEGSSQTKSYIWTDNGDGTFTTGETTVKIGDYVNYTYDTANNYELSKAHSGYTSDQTIPQVTGLQWRVLGINGNGQLELVSATPVNNYVYFQGSAGYNNGVFLLNNICASQYANSSLGVTARSLNLEDIEKQYSDNGKNARDVYSDGYRSYGKIWKISWGENYYPSLYAEEALSGVNGYTREGGIGQSDSYYTDISQLPQGESNSMTGSIVLYGSYYSIHLNRDYFKNENFYDMIICDSDYWLASRMVEDYYYTTYGIVRMSSANIGKSAMFSLYGNNWEFCNYLRPVVTLGSNISVVTNSEPNSSTNMWTLNK